MKTVIYLFIAALSLAFAGEEMPDFNAILAETNTKIEIPTFQMEAPKDTATLKGTPAIKENRDAESISETVRKNQSRLTNIYKTYTIKRGISINRLYDLSITIDKDGNIIKVNIKGPTNKDFLEEAAQIVKTWQFEKVSNPTPKSVNLRNLDFNYRSELVME